MKLIPYNRQLIEQDDIKNVLLATKQDLITTGSFNNNLEKEFKKKFKVKYSITCNNGTSALFIALKSVNLKEGDAVIMPSINFVAAANISSILKANIFLTDVDPLTGQMTAKNLEDCIKKNNLKKIKAVFSMYLGGAPFYIKEIYKLKKKYRFILIEDACHALGTKYRLNQKIFRVGSCQHSDICIFSFHPTKSITAGEGGIVLTNIKKYFNQGFLIRNHGMEKKYLNKNISIEYDIIQNSLNFRLSDINAALTLSQLKKLDKFIKKRNIIAKNYFTKLNVNKYLSLPKVSSEINSSWHLFQLNLNISKNKKEKFIYYLYKNKILTQIHYKPLYKFKIFKHLKTSKISFLGSEKFYAKTLSIPLHLHLNAKKINKICVKINNFFKK